MANRFLSNIRINDAYTFPASDGTSGQVIGTDGAGNLSFINIESEAGSTVIYKDNFSGDNSTVTFTLAHVVSDEVVTQVYMDGVYQNKDTYIVSGDQITFDSAPPTGVEIEVISFNTVSTQGIIAYNGKNSTGSTIAAGTAVMAVGTDGNSGHILIAPMVADGSVEPKYFMGVTADEVINGEYVDVVHFGVIGKINTSSFSDGDVLWLDPSNNGGFTTTEPNAPSIKMSAAIVLNSSTNGKIFVRVQGNEGLHELHDVHIENLAAKDLLVWNSTQGYWENSKQVYNLIATGTTSVEQISPLTAGNNIVLAGNVSAGDITSSDLYGYTFYHRTNTNYYVNPAGSSIINNLSVGLNPSYSSVTTSAYGSDTRELINPPDAIYPYSVGTKYFGYNYRTYFYGPLSTYYTGKITGANFYWYNNMYVGKLYDNDNTSYYLDPASSSNLSSLNVVGNITTDGTVDGVDISAFKAAYDVHTHVEGDITDFGNYLTNITHDTVNNKLVVTTRDAATFDVDLTQYIDDSNLARLTSGSLDSGTGIATFTRDDATTFTVDFSALFDDTDTNDFLTGASFNTADGVLTLNVSNQTDVTVDLDGRYLESYTETDTLATVTGRGATTSSAIETGRLTIANNVSTGGFGSFDDYQIILYKDVAAGLSYGLGVESGTLMFHTNGAYKFYANNAVKATISNSGDLTLIGTISASGYNNSNWDTAYGWGDHSTAGYQAASSAITTSNIASQSVDNADKLDGRHLDGTIGIGERLFNNQGRNHDTFIDFNSTAIRSGANYLQQGTNGPTGTTSHQWYGFRLGLGADYGTVTGSGGHYASDLYWGRQSQGGNPYLWSRDMEGGTWGSWRKMYSGYADNAGLLNGWSRAQSGANVVLQTASNGYLYIGNWIQPALGTGLFYTSGPHFYESGGTMYSSHTLRSADSLRAPIFYDEDDTGYYVNPNGTSNLLGPLNIYDGDAAANPRISLGRSASQRLYISVDDRVATIGHQQDEGSGEHSLEFYINSPTASNDKVFYWKTNDGTLAWLDSAGFKSNVFYDRDNTGYYVDPNGTSHVYAINDAYDNNYLSRRHSGSDFTAGTLVTTDIDASGFGGISFVIEVTGKSYSSTPPFSFLAQGYFYNYGIINASGVNNGDPRLTYIKAMELGGKLAFWWPRVSYWNSFDVLVRDANGATRNRVNGINDSSEPTSATKVTQINLAMSTMYGYNTNAGALYATTYFDATNTNYFVDPDSTSTIRKTNIVASGSAWDAGLNLYSNNGSDRWNLLTDEGSANMLRFAYNNSEKFRIQTNGEVYTIGTGLAGSDYRAPIFYDSNDTYYYVDPASDSRQNNITANRIGVNPSGSQSSRYGVSLYGGYNGGEPTYGLLFTGTSLGTHGSVTGSWATYFTMNNDTSRGWIFRRVGSGNCASISAGGHATFDGSVITPFVDIDKTSQYGPGMDLTFSGSNSTGILIRNNTGTTTSAVLFYYSSAPQGARGSITVSSTSTAYNTSSDYRLKENVIPMTGSLERVDQLNPSRFNFIGDDKTVDGFLAHEAAEVVPEAVTGTKDEVDEEGNPVYQGIDQAKLVPLLVGAIQELKAEVEALKQQLNGTN